LKLKPLGEQVMVITGASSGIGLATARRAAARGAKVMLAARNAQALEAVARDIVAAGGEAHQLAVDLADEGSAERLAEAATARFGRIDSWVNNAAAAMYARLDQVSLEEHRRVFDVGYFGLVQGSLAALPRLKLQGGALINVGSVLSNRAIPLQGPYCAMKAAVMQFTDALRMELEQAEAPVSVTLIKPAAIDTPYPEHARNKLDEPARLPQPLYDVELVAKAICFAASNPRRSLYVGGGGLGISWLAPAMPRLADKGMELIGGKPLQTSSVPPEPDAADNLFEPRADGRTESNQRPFTRQTSLALEAQLHPLATAAIVGGVAAAAAGAFLLRRGGPDDVGTREAQRRIRAAGLS